jgi:hypothetical protein
MLFFNVILPQVILEIAAQTFAFGVVGHVSVDASCGLFRCVESVVAVLTQTFRDFPARSVRALLHLLFFLSIDRDCLLRHNMAILLKQFLNDALIMVD